ncbi:MAG: rRNA maturation RNase YbeY [Lachnospiraceae bacterium]|nr:rRNA maturation RNase YbeY [Lachnospiraceae bacterium]
MTFYVEQEVGLFSEEKTEPDFFDIEQVTKLVIETVLDFEGCPFEVIVNIVLVDDESITEVNQETRGIGKATDVLSFPALDFSKPADFTDIEDDITNFDPDSGELLLGDIIISADRLKEQSEAYGHGKKREYAFLLTHSLLHLLGYDHMEHLEAEIMEKKQETILDQIGIFRIEV